MAPVRDVSAMKDSLKIINCEYFFEKFWHVGLVG